ncbi:hypothetical protein JW906_16190, partial [bacterium]|nr:hypothetical protein [bacterium]
MKKTTQIPGIPGGVRPFIRALTGAGFLTLACALYSQTTRVIDVIGVEEGHATISAGSHAGVSAGDQFRILRRTAGQQTEIARGEAVQVQYSRSRISITQKTGTASIRIGDRVEPVSAASAATRSTGSAPAVNTVRQSPQTAAAGTAVRSSTP